MNNQTMNSGDKGAKQRHPKPWRKDDNGFVVDANGIDVAWYEHIDEALIAVNCHAELLDACQTIDHVTMLIDNNMASFHDLRIAVAKCQSAIAKAEGRTA